jgi:hypothetical protein
MSQDPFVSCDLLDGRPWQRVPGCSFNTAVLILRDAYRTERQYIVAMLIDDARAGRADKKATGRAVAMILRSAGDFYMGD